MPDQLYDEKGQNKLKCDLETLFDSDNSVSFVKDILISNDLILSFADFVCQ